MSDDHTLLFVGGLHHSGTTLLTRALRQHPAISGLRGTGVPEDEGQHLQSVIPAAVELVEHELEVVLLLLIAILFIQQLLEEEVQVQLLMQ